jgi:hypothetical protein
MDKLYKRNQLNDLSYKDTLAQPLDLKESLRIRDGLAEHEVPLHRWPQCWTVRLGIYDLGQLWVCNN